MENCITIRIDEYKDLIRAAVENEFKLKIQRLEEDLKSSHETENYWYKRWQDTKTELDDIKSFYNITGKFEKPEEKEEF